MGTQTRRSATDRCISSVWELTDEERQFIARGYNIQLTIIAAIQPPISYEIDQRASR